MASIRIHAMGLTMPPLTSYETPLVSIFETSRVPMVICLLFLIPFIFNYTFSWVAYHWQHMRIKDCQLPPEYPTFVPYLGGLIPLLVYGEDFLTRATSYAGKLTSARAYVLGDDYYFVQDRESVMALWKQRTLSSPMTPYILTLKHLFGMEKKALSTYQADTSGPFPQPYPGSEVEPKNRVDRITHQFLLKGLTGPGLKPLIERTATSIRQKLERLPVSDEWVEYPDMLELFQEIVGSSIIESLAGPSLLKVNPTFLVDYWKFDSYVTWFARGVPSFLIPRGFAIRSSLLSQIREWYSYARSNFDESSIGKDGDFDPYWGSTLMRLRQKSLPKIENHDDAAHASTDLGLIWASVSNVVPVSAFSTMHIFKETGLLGRVRHTVDDVGQLGSNISQVVNAPLLQSIYMETLRMYAKSHFIATSPHTNLNIGKWHIPKGKIIFVNSGISHMDKNFWNTKSGLWPVENFWADRFVTDPNDAQSGPMLPEIAREVRASSKSSQYNSEKPHISLEGLEGSWVPYGGGHAICPGRFLAKATVITASALMVSMFELELMTDSVEVSSGKFGLGALRPKNAVPLRLRRRRVG